jgi:hypothetical protein
LARRKAHFHKHAFAAHDLALNAMARLKAKNVTLNVYQYFIEMKMKLANRLTSYQMMIYTGSWLVNRQTPSRRRLAVAESQASGRRVKAVAAALNLAESRKERNLERTRYQLEHAKPPNRSGND